MPSLFASNSLCQDNIPLRRQVADKLFPGIAWDSETHGFLPCPFADLHTKPNARTDCNIDVDGGATLHCYHASCEPSREGANHELRRQIGFAERGEVVTVTTKLPTRPSAPRPAKPAFDPATLESIARRLEGIDEAWFAARSKKRVDNRTPASFLHELYEPGERVVIFDNFQSQGQKVWKHTGAPFDAGALDSFREGKPCGVWFMANPVTGASAENGNGKRSIRSAANVTAWRYAVVESDDADPVHWLAALAQLPLRISAIYSSGKRSIHSLVRLDAGSKEEWDSIIAEIEPALVTMGACSGALTAVRLSRLPMCQRLGDTDRAGVYVPFPDGPHLQRLIYLDGSPDGTPICEKEEI